MLRLRYKMAVREYYVLIETLLPIFMESVFIQTFCFGLVVSLSQRAAFWNESPVLLQPILLLSKIRLSVDIRTRYRPEDPDYSQGVPAERAVRHDGDAAQRVSVRGVGRVRARV